jgi:LysR family transcriptional regulator, glycine cleavage system transcriptional activator
MISLRPSLNALRAFETMARLGSMTLAAHELGVSHGAISRQVRSLEELLGVSLHTKQGNNAIPTEVGQRLAAELTPAFHAIQSSLALFMPGPITLSCSSTIMMRWLIPRIEDFRRRFPTIEVKFNLSHDKIDFVHDEINLAIRNSMIAPPKQAQVRNLMPEWIGPICTPELARRLNLRMPEDLARTRLLHTKTRPLAWREWMQSCGVDFPNPQSDAPFEHFYLLIQAAISGLGVAMVPHMLVEEDLQSGRLVAPLGFVKGPHAIQLWLPPYLREKRETETLADWLAEHMRDDGLSLTQASLAL